MQVYNTFLLNSTLKLNYFIFYPNSYLESTIQAEIEAVSEMDFVGSSAKDYFKTSELTADEQTEMERYMTLEHIVRLAKAEALQKINAHAA